MVTWRPSVQIAVRAEVKCLKERERERESVRVCARARVCVCARLQEHLLFVVEYVSGGDMVEELEKVGVFSKERARFYTAEITLALEFLHRYGILHQ